MRSMLFAGAGLLAVVAAPATLIAQPAPGTVIASDGRTYALTPAQQAMFDAWTADQRASYGAWPYDYRVYYWTLTPEQTRGWWALTDEQRGQVYALTPEQRAAAWTSITAQLAQAPIQTQANPPGAGTPTMTPPNPQTAADPVPPAMPADPSYQGGPYQGAMTAPPAEAMNKSYPVCTRAGQDNCQNAGEGGAPGRSRALNHWPGRPASEIRARRGQ